MQQLSIHPLPFAVDSEQWFERVRHLKRPVFLDSNAERNQNGQGRFDIIAADPIATLKTHGDKTYINQGTKNEVSLDCPFSLLKAQLARAKETAPTLLDLPFNGGAIGYFSYDLGRRLERLPTHAARDISVAEMDIGLYNWAILKDFQRQRAYLIARPECSSDEQKFLLDILTQPEIRRVEEDFILTSEFRANLSEQQYRQKYQRIIDYIEAGDCYQVNLTQRFDCGYQGSEWQAYKYLRQQSDAAFSAFLQLEDCALLSLSPERFLAVRGSHVETKPIKGTRPRSSDPKKDLQNAQLLRNSTKDRAENLMIVDLLRNDLSKACRLASVNVPRLFEIEAYSNVYHLVSTIQGKLRPGVDSLDLLRACFPGGSITGTPKLRAMEIIDELEPQRRSIYCGSVGYIDYNGNMDSNIAIRSLLGHQDLLYCWGGGAIVADSDADEEYRESLVKIRYLMESLQKLSVSNKQIAERQDSYGEPS